MVRLEKLVRFQAVHDPQFYQSLRQQLQRPSFPTRRGLAVGQGFQDGFSLFIQLLLPAWSRSFVESASKGCQALFWRRLAVYVLVQAGDEGTRRGFASLEDLVAFLRENLQTGITQVHPALLLVLAHGGQYGSAKQN